HKVQLKALLPEPLKNVAEDREQSCDLAPAAAWKNGQQLPAARDAVAIPKAVSRLDGSHFSRSCRGECLDRGMADERCRQTGRLEIRRLEGQQSQQMIVEPRHAPGTTRPPGPDG